MPVGCDAQVHAQVQEGVRAPGLDVVDRGQRGCQVGKVLRVLRVLGDPGRGLGLDRIERQTLALPASGLAEEAPHIVLGGLEHHAIVARGPGETRLLAGSCLGVSPESTRVWRG
jgi:hypothetical protein